MNRRQTFAIGAVAVAAAAAGVGVGVWHRPDPTTGTATQLPPGFWSLRFARPEGGELALADFRGQALVINFWATWCPPCVRELPEIDRFAAEHATQGVRTIALAVDGPTPVNEFLQRVRLTLPVGLAGLDGSELSRQLGNTQGALPFTVLLTADGGLAQRRLGETSRVELERWVAAINRR
jgi:thiol-disulfide isomerase/thioredoxin